MNKIDTFEQREEYTRNKGRIERAIWFEKKLIYNEIEYSVMYISSAYPPEFIKDLPKLGNTFNIVDVRTWKSYEAYMNVEKHQISSLKELYKDKGNKIKEGIVIGIANSPENINEVWVDFEQGEENWLDKDREKVIVLSMMAIRAFSEKFSLNLRNKEIREKLKGVMNMSHRLLKELDIIKLDKDDIYGNGDWIDPVVDIFMLNSRNIQKKTNGLLRNSGDMAYFLNVTQGSEIRKKDIVSLLNIVIGKEFSNLDKICDFCIEISRQKSRDFFNSYEHIFALPKYDNIMKDIITKDMILLNMTV